MADETEYKGFQISLRLIGNAWTATIEKRDGASLLVNLDTPPRDTAIDAMKLALDVIDAGGGL
jgi:hypothetical protein